MSVGLGSVDLVPPGAELTRVKESPEVFPAGLCCWAQPWLCGTLSDTQCPAAEQGGLAGGARALQSPSGAALWPGCHQEQSLLLLHISGFPV